MDSNVFDTFWKAIEIYILKPHVVNKRVSGIVHVGYAELPADVDITSDEFVGALASQMAATIQDTLSLGIGACRHLTFIEDCDQVVQCLSQEPARHDRLVLVNKLLSKNTKFFNNSYEMVVLDFTTHTATFICAVDSTASNHCSAANPPYCIDFQHNQIALHSIGKGTEPTPSKSVHWLQNTLLPKLRNWSTPVDDANDSQRTSIGTHRLLDSQEEYINLYNELKLKYGVDMVERWPEQTDAAKFVYEDVAIATYLLVLWRQERTATNTERLQSFVDLGCGNGLLVFILSSEGHRGYGIDLRKRGIWDMYPETTELKIEAIVPSDDCLYPDIDWIIGNHSDELSPWIPVIAARSAPTTRYFLLPCCAFEFNGNKFQRRNTSDSQYNGFLAYVEQISNECGFQTAMDRLKIPSTKRVCLVGSQNGAASEFVDNCRRIQRFIDAETKTTAEDPQRAWSTAFKPRPSVEEVRNCSRLDRSIQSEIVDIVVKHLLAKRRYLDTVPAALKWNVGGQCPIVDLVQLISAELLKELKSECGGLQTLLRNHNQIFLVQKGMVQIRAPITRSERAALVAQKKLKALVKTRQCWFFEHHPDGCPFESEECSFLHADKS